MATDRATDMVAEMHAALAADPYAYRTTEQLQQGLDVSKKRDVAVGDYAARMGVTTPTQSELAFAQASRQALEDYTNSWLVYQQSETVENYARMLTNGNVYVALKNQGQNMLESRVDALAQAAAQAAQPYDPVRAAAQGNAQSAAQGYGSVGQAAQALLPRDSQGRSREQRSTQQSADTYSQYSGNSQGSGNKRQRRGGPSQ
ncbi:hypothetical protein [Streptomyces ziwulingensis]|uniref:Uncharacterized protein n=1 Tax=Streptomyces ziwulingensis TaxID=1045501 RepID=A0ABP9B2H8_9ACTN